MKFISLDDILHSIGTYPTLCCFFLLCPIHRITARIPNNKQAPPPPVLVEQPVPPHPPARQPDALPLFGVVEAAQRILDAVVPHDDARHVLAAAAALLRGVRGHRG